MLVTRHVDVILGGAEEGIAERNARGTRRRAGRARGRITVKRRPKIVSINILISYIIYISKRGRTRWK